MTIRTIQVSDYPQLESFWKENYLITPLDDRKRVELFLQKNPDLSVLALEDNKIIGTVLSSFDGRRGYIQKVVVSKQHRKRGIGQQLVHEIIKRLEQAGAIDIRLNFAEELVHFYESCGFKTVIKPLMTIKKF